MARVTVCGGARLLERVGRGKHQGAGLPEILKPVELPLLDALGVGIAPQRRAVADAGGIILRGQPIRRRPGGRTAGETQDGKQNQSIHGRPPHIRAAFIPSFEFLTATFPRVQIK